MAKDLRKQDIKDIVGFINQDREEITKRLYYLEKSGRFKEFPGYEDETFEHFYKNLFPEENYDWSIPSYSRYKDITFAYDKYPEETEKFGLNTIIRIKKELGDKRIPEALKKLNSKVRKLKKPHRLLRVKTSEVIASFKQKPKKGGD